MNEEQTDDNAGTGIGLPESEEVIEAEPEKKRKGEKGAGESFLGIRQESFAADSAGSLKFPPGKHGHDDQ